ncbi:MAG: site-2 protease family protein [Candidatus Falkowbacteria bacterium]|nr:site-2 protease family protein [Candidatus Falkowbacteria bacterium]
MQDTSLMLFQIVTLIFSAIIHEYMHGWMAYQLGDTTARDAGRLTLNPLPHIDPVGSILMPALMIFARFPFVFGWAKPVPFNPYNLRDQKWGIAKVAIAGALGNLITALFFGLILRFVPLANSVFILMIGIIVYINLLLAVFNLVPIPPLDGAKVIMPFLPFNWQQRFYELERYGFILVIMFVYLGFNLILPIINGLFYLIVGQRLF